WILPEPHPTRPLPGGEQAFVHCVSVPLLGGVRGGFMVAMRGIKVVEVLQEPFRGADIPVCGFTGHSYPALLGPSKLASGRRVSDLTFQEILAGNTIAFIFPLRVVLVFLTLAAQYES